MSLREPALLGDRAEDAPGAAGDDDDVAVAPPPRPSSPAVSRASARGQAPTVYVVGFWRRLAGALVDSAIVLPAAIVITVIASRLAGVHLPPSNLGVLDVDLWIDLVLASDPALLMGVGLTVAIGLCYLLVFHVALGRTLGMRLLRIKIIDAYGDAPTPGRCALRVASYAVGLATLFLGFLWIGFDSEKRGLHDWIAGTYVVRG
jgi:uncharacterized RDD family membrane protein YckC